MRLLKRQTTNRRSISGKGIFYDVADLVTVDTTNSMIVPKGTGDTAESEGTELNQRPLPATWTNGMVRYNTDTDQFEVYQNSAWRNIRFKEPNQDPGIVWQNLGNGDGVETVFGELNSGDTDYPEPAASENIIVLVENVVQVPGTNYDIAQTAGVDITGPNTPYTETDTGWWIEFTSPVPFGKPVVVVHNLDK